MARQHSYLSGQSRYVGVRRNAAYVVLADSQYEHRALWQTHHGVLLDSRYIVHHKDEDKTNNTVCRDRSGHCPNWACGNLGAMTRREHILEHRPGRMGGRKIPNKSGHTEYFCRECGIRCSRNGPRCRQCYLDSLVRG